MNLIDHLSYLKLPFIREHYEAIGKTAARKQWDHVHYLSELVKQESNLRRDRCIQRRIKMARFPVIKTMDQCGGGVNPRPHTFAHSLYPVLKGTSCRPHKPRTPRPHTQESSLLGQPFHIPQLEMICRCHAQ